MKTESNTSKFIRTLIFFVFWVIILIAPKDKTEWFLGHVIGMDFGDAAVIAGLIRFAKLPAIVFSFIGLTQLCTYGDELRYAARNHTKPEFNSVFIDNAYNFSDARNSDLPDSHLSPAEKIKFRAYKRYFDELNKK